MDPGSSFESESDQGSRDGPFQVPRGKKRGRKPKSAPTTPTTPRVETKRPALERQITAETNNMDTTSTPTTLESTLTSPKTKTTIEITGKKPLTNKSHTFTVYLKTTISRLEFALRWEELVPGNQDIIIKLEKTFRIKTNDEKTTNGLMTLTNSGTVSSFNLTSSPNSTLNTSNSTANPLLIPTYSAVVTGVDLEISDDLFRQNLEKIGLTKIRFCKRIISRARNTPTYMIRLITGNLATYEKLMNGRTVQFLGRVFRVVESKPPPPVPAPCSKCNQYSHRTEDCKQPIKCTKCQGPHSTSTCKSPLPPKCIVCNSEEHAAWSRKCPKRPTAPIEGIPNVKIKCINRTTTEVSQSVKEQSRIHSPLTTHNYIINKYKHQINKSNNLNRDELLKKLKKQFIDDFKVDTSVVFFGSYMYILMLDILEPNRSSHTEPQDQLRQTITNLQPSQ
ncbi:uncharacterized protein [Euwallacea fornicatus]|uniref:uncharacterized protein n=1 Tax=Euwallacea fornicatus TaxID=995702 RepID=UPI003390730B